MRRFVVAFCACVWAAPGCYSYQVSTLEDVVPGEAIRLRISAAEAERLAELRLTEDRLVPGTLVQRDDGEVLIDTQVGQNDSSRGTRALTQRITVPTGEVREVELRRLDWFRTGALIGAAGVGVGIALAAAIGGGDGRSDNGGPDTGELVVPILRFRIPFAFSF